MEKLPQTYVATKRIGSGGFGTVFLGFDNTGKEVVIKRSLFSGSLTEVETLQECQHIPGVVKLLDYFIDTSVNHLVIVMPKVSACKDLFDFITDRDKLEEDLAKNFFRQMVKVTKALYDHGIVHCDIKDENFIVNLATLELTLIDFGAAKKLTDFQKTSLTGTKIYYPPELFEKGRCDPMHMTVWSLGLVLYIMLTGSDPANFASAVRPRANFSCGEKAKDLILKCTELDPKKRFTFDQICNHEWLAN